MVSTSIDGKQDIMEEQNFSLSLKVAKCLIVKPSGCRSGYNWPYCAHTSPAAVDLETSEWLAFI